jgi:hypothetical protein
MAVLIAPPFRTMEKAMVAVGLLKDMDSDGYLIQKKKEDDNPGLVVIPKVHYWLLGQKITPEN